MAKILHSQSQVSQVNFARDILDENGVIGQVHLGVGFNSDVSNIDFNDPQQVGVIFNEVGKGFIALTSGFVVLVEVISVEIYGGDRILVNFTQVNLDTAKMYNSNHITNLQILVLYSEHIFSDMAPGTRHHVGIEFLDKPVEESSDLDTTDVPVDQPTVDQDKEYN